MVFGRLKSWIEDKTGKKREKFLPEVISTIENLPLLKGRIKISEVHEGDKRLAILVPNSHGDPTKEDGGESSPELKAIKDLWIEMYYSLTKANISRTVAVESRPFSRKPFHVDKDFGAEYGLEDPDNIAFSHVLVGYRFFLPQYLMNMKNRDELQTALNAGKKAGDFLFDRFVGSPNYERTYENASPVLLSRRTEITSAVKKEVADVTDQLFSSADAITFENAQALLQGLNHLFDTHVAIRRNELIAENIVRIFESERDEPVIVHLGANHFSKDGGLSGIPLNTVQELLREKGCSYVIVTPNLVAERIKK
jgi:hypothetical protein